MQDSIFTKIINRELPAEVIYEDEHVIVIPDRFPSMKGQLLVITKRQVPYAFDLTDEEYRALMDTTKRVAKALDVAFGTIRTCAIIEGFDVPHVHVRLYPCVTEEVTWSPRHEAQNEALKEVADLVRSKLS